MIDFDDIRLIALDLDDTTLDEHGALNERTREAINAAINRGIHIVIASGRGYCALPGDVLNLKGIEYAITSNGAAVYSTADDRCIHNCKLLDKSVREILTLQDKFKVVFEVFIDGKAFADSRYVSDPVAFGSSPKAVNYIQNTRKPVENIREFILNNANSLDSVDIVVKDMSEKKTIADYLKERDRDIYVTSSVPYLVEVAYKDVGKGSALTWLCNSLNINLSDCAAFGNGDNDIDMISQCGLGIAVGNGTEGCLKAADIITDTNYNFGVAKIIEQILALR